MSDHKCKNLVDKECACTNTECERNNKCCLCTAHHASRGNLPACLRPKQEETK